MQQNAKRKHPMAMVIPTACIIILVHAAVKDTLTVPVASVD